MTEVPYKLMRPPPCESCGIEAGGDHKQGCAVLSAMRAQVYPEVLEQNGLPWYENTIAKLTEENEKLRANNALIFNKMKEALEKSYKSNARSPIIYDTDDLQSNKPLVDKENP